MAKLFNNRYKVIQELGRGGMGAVYLVQDALRDGQAVALKTIRADVVGERNLAQFKYEFAALGQLRHPNLVAVYDFGVVADSGEYFFTMEYVPGDDLSTAVKRSPFNAGRLDWLYEITVQVCRALQYIHSRGFIHYDVKPRNIRVTPEGNVKLMDFGLIGEARGEGQLKVRGTPEYIAPELIRGDPVDHRADLYSLGVSLYEIITGRPPYADTSSMVVLRQHVEAAPEPPRHFAPDIPEGLQNLVLKLLAKEPAARCGSADEVIQAINALSGASFPVETKETKRGYIQSGRCVGREFELARLQGLLMRALQGQGRLVFISGAAGVGKTRLARELRLRAQMQRALVCEGACREQVRAPYRPWIYNIFSQVISHLKSSRPETVQTYGAALVKLMPELSTQLEPALPGGAAASKADLLEAAAQFLSACDAPLVLILEDLQYADAETIELLEYVGQRASGARLLLCGIYRDDEVGPAHPLSKLVQQARVISRHGSKTSLTAEERPYDLLRLDPLTEADVADLVKSMLGIADPGKTFPLADLQQQLVAETGGNPMFIESIMHNLVEEDLLQYDGQVWRLNATRLALPQNIQQAAQRRLARLMEQPESLELLQWAAVMGSWLDLDVLAQVCSLPLDQVFNLLNDAVRQHVLAAGEQGGERVYYFSTAQMRQAIYNTLSPEQRQERHRRLGQALRELYSESQVAEWLAWHFERADEPRLALHYFQLAADKARQSYANESAIQHYSRALALLRERLAPDFQLEYDLLDGRSECYRLVGNLRAQQSDLNDMVRLAQALGDASRQIKAATRQVDLSNVLGKHADARRAAQAALDLAQQTGDRKLEAGILASLGETCYRLADFAGAQACHEQALALCRELADRRGEALNLRQIGRIFSRLGQAAQALECFEKSLNISRAIGDRPGEAAALSSLGVLSSDYAKKRAYQEQALAISQDLGDRNNQARAYNNLAVIYWSLGLYGKARDYLEPAVQIQRELGGRNSLGYYLETLGRIYLELQDYAQAQQALEEGVAIASDIGDRFVEAVYRMMLGRVALARGLPDQARESIARACDMLRGINAVDYLVTALAWLGAAHLALGEWEAAHRFTSEAVAHLDKIGAAADFPTQDIWWLHYLVLKAGAGREGAALSEQAWAALQRARETMLSAITTLSDEGLRRNYLNKVRINSDIITEWTRQLAHRGDKEALQAIAAPQAAAEQAEASRAQDRLKRVLDISIQMNETHDAESLLNYVMDQVIELSGAERGFLVLVDEKTNQMDFRVARGMAQDELERAKAQISYTVLGTVAQSRQPVLLQDALTDERFGRQSSVLELNLRSVLCVPLLARSELAGMIYTDNRSVSGRFSQTDVDLMAIFANQAATALENARLYQETIRANQELEAWAHTLEQRVAERTAQLQQANTALSRRAVQLETSSQVGRQVTSILDLDELLFQVVNLIQERFGYYFVGVWLVTDKRDAVVLLAGSGRAGEALTEQTIRIPLEAASIVTGVCRGGQLRLVDDVFAAPDFMAVTELAETRSELTLPLRMGEVIIGALDIQSNQPAAFSAEDQMVLQTLADQIAIAIRNAQFYQAEQTRRWFAEALEQAGRALSSSLDLSQVPVSILEQLATVAPYERGSVFLQQADTLHLIAQRGFPANYQPAGLRIPIRQGDVFEQVVATCRAVIVDDVTQAPGWQQMEGLPLDKSWMGIPLISKDKVIGMMSLTRREAAAFSPDDATLASAFAGQAAIALENARLYDEITRFNEQLEQMVQQRTEELNLAYRTLERLDKTKTDFINVAAHELRTPLTVIKGYTQLLAADPLTAQNDNFKSLLAGILGGADRLHDIVNSMLDVTKIDSQTMRMRRERTHLYPIIESIHADLRAALHERRLTFSTTGLDSLPMIQADPDLLFKVFYHLIINAVKYTPDGGSITVSGQASSDAVEIMVSDTGIGIDPAHHELIFEKFYQTGEVAVHSSGKTKFKGGGPGLGLAIAKGIVRAHGGKIWVESAGHDEQHCPGSRFHVVLPVDIPPTLQLPRKI